MTSRFLATVASLCLAFATQDALAQTYPTKPVTLIVPSAPGGAADALSRILAQKLNESMGQPVVVDNRAGAGGVLGVEIATRSPKDGHSLMLGMAGAIAINPSLHKKLSYDPARDLVPIGLVARSPLILVVNPSVPVRSVRELVALAKQKQGELPYASAGNGSIEHLAAELFSHKAGVQMLHVPYKGSAAAITDLLAGRVSVLFENALSVLPYIKDGRLRAIAVLGSARSPLFPEMPTVAETGVPDYAVQGWYGMFAPVGTDPAIVQRLNGELLQILKSPDVSARLSGLGLEPAGGSPEEFAVHIRQETAKWKSVISAANIQAD